MPTGVYEHKTRSLAERFWAKVDSSGPVVRPELGPCSLWTGAAAGGGYGQVRVGPRKVQAHRVAFFLAFGRWPEPFALHKCDNRSCVRSDHLFEGTHAENMVDKVNKGRQSRAGQRPGELHSNAKLSDADVLAIRQAGATGETHRSIAKRYGVSHSCVGRVLNGKTWTHVGAEQP